MRHRGQLSLSAHHQLAIGSAYGVTDVGLVRDSNEDNFLIDPALGLVVIGDGMGGHDGGDIASASALLALRDYLHDAQERGGEQQRTLAHVRDPDATCRDERMPAVLTMFDAIEYANTQVYQANLRDDMIEGRGMGTTLTGFWHSAHAGPLIVFHVGDCRLYRYREGELTILTHDQTLYQQAIEEGEVDNLPARNLLLQAVGPSARVTPDVTPVQHQDNDVYMLCSDGLYGAAPHAGIADVLAAVKAHNLAQCCADLIALAKQHGSRDNITALITLCQPG